MAPRPATALLVPFAIVSHTTHSAAREPPRRHCRSTRGVKRMTRMSGVLGWVRGTVSQGRAGSQGLAAGRVKTVIRHVQYKLR